jgi:ketosteroid isomerase-like protein
MPRENVKLVERAYEGYAKRDIEEHRHLFAEGFRFNMRPEFPIQGSYSVDEIPEFWTDLDETFTDYRLVPTDYLEAGDWVLVTLDSSARMKGSGAIIEDTIYHRWHVRDGKIVEAWTHSDRAEALEAVGLSE